MNLHALARPLITSVNPEVDAVLRVSTGIAATAPDGTRIPGYAPDQNVRAQVQDLSQRDLRQLEGLNVQGSQKVAYLSGLVQAVVRPSQKGGDLLLIPADGTWLTTAVLESWPDWCKVSITLQMDQ